MKSSLLLFSSILFTIIISEVIVRNIDLKTKTNTENIEDINTDHFSLETRRMFSKVPTPIIKDFVDFKTKFIDSNEMIVANQNQSMTKNELNESSNFNQSNNSMYKNWITILNDKVHNADDFSSYCNDLNQSIGYFKI
jgi:hypothetical protein